MWFALHTTLWHFDASERAPSTATLAVILRRGSHERFTLETFMASIRCPDAYLCWAACKKHVQALGALPGAKPMWILIVYVLIVVIGEAIVIAIGLILDRIFPLASLPVSLTLFFAVLAFGWLLAVRWTEPKHAKRAKPVS
jgi:hypothetical protein